MRPGQKLTSQVCDTQVVVVRAATTDVTLTCGGAPMVDGAVDGPDAAPAAGLDGGTVLGKRYVHDDLGLEVLCSRAGAGSLAVDGDLLAIKAAKALPASD